MGGSSKGSQSTDVKLSPAQEETISLQNDFLKSYLPTLSGVTQGAGQAYQGQAGQLNQASQNAINTANNVGNIQGNVGSSALQQGTQGLSNLFSPQYEQEQVQGALAPAEQAAQRANVAQQAGFAGAGELGSARDALASQQTQNINQQTLGSIAAQTEAGITAGRANAGQSLINAGTANLGQASGTIGSTLGYASAPLTNYGQYASLLFGAPSQTPNYSGTQSSSQSGSGKNSGINLSDMRLKRFVHVLDYGLAEVKKLIPVSWLWKDVQVYGDRKEIGFIAQDVQALIPEVVSKKDGYLGIDYPRLTAVLVNAIKQQQTQIDDLARKIEELKHELPA